MRIREARRDLANRPCVWLGADVFGAPASAVSQSPNSEQSSPAAKSDLRGKSIFETRCATCHGLDGLGGEHAPDIIRRPAVKALSDQALLDVIHDGIPKRECPDFPRWRKKMLMRSLLICASCKASQPGSLSRGDPARGKDLFFGKAGCSACHQIGSPGQFIAEDLAGFARDHPAGIRDAILRPAGEPQEAATAVARDGRKFSGMIRNEDNASLQLQEKMAGFICS